LTHEGKEYAARLHLQLATYDVPSERIFWDRAADAIHPLQEYRQRIRTRSSRPGVELLLVCENFRK